MCLKSKIISSLLFEWQVMEIAALLDMFTHRGGENGSQTQRLGCKKHS